MDFDKSMIRGKKYIKHCKPTEPFMGDVPYFEHKVVLLHNTKEIVKDQKLFSRRPVSARQRNIKEKDSTQSSLQANI